MQLSLVTRSHVGSQGCSLAPQSGGAGSSHRPERRLFVSTFSFSPPPTFSPPQGQAGLRRLRGEAPEEESVACTELPSPSISQRCFLLSDALEVSPAVASNLQFLWPDAAGFP